jgi:spermidine/putrescine transport system substrate-binding protein
MTPARGTEQDMTARRPIDPDIARVLAAGGLTRRSFLRRLGGAGAVLLGGSTLAACGITGGRTDTPVQTDPGQGEVGGTLRFANWTLYIDLDDDEATSPTLEQFEEEFGVSVDYIEEINSNDEWFGRFRNQLAAGQSIDRDLAVLTDWMAGRLIRLGWLSELDRGNIPNAGNILPALADVAFDPGRRYSLTWQSGLTGIGYDPGAVGRRLTSINDLFADDLAGRVTFLTEMRDTTSLVMASMGADPANHEFSEYEAAIARLQEAVDSGHIRAFTGNEYVNDLAAGNIAAAVAWSGDIVQLQLDNPDLEFVLPAEGGLLWSDNMLVPANPPNQRTAEAFMDFVYRPEIAAQIAAWVNYISPVQGAQEAMEELDPELAEDELIFPSAETLAQTFEFKSLDEDEEAEYQRLFQGVIGA